MKEITEDYCDFETAKLLKAKGFNEKCLRTYFHDGKMSRIFDDNDWIYNENLLPSVVAAPTLQMAMKWLREVHNFNIIAFPAWDNYDGTKMSFEKWGESIDGLDGEYYMSISGPVYYNSYEDACEAAIKYVLENLI